MGISQRPNPLSPPFTDAGGRWMWLGRRRSGVRSIESEANTTGEHVRDGLLITLTVASGAVDAISYFSLGQIFSAFMTGNIVFLGFGIANIKGPWLPIVLALSTFAVGSYVGFRIANRRTQESGLWPPRMSLLLALVAMAEAGFLAVSSATAGHPPTEISCVLIVFFLADNGDPDRGGPIVGRAGCVHYGRHLHTGRSHSYSRRGSFAGRDAAFNRGSRRIGLGRHRGRAALHSRTRLRPCTATRDHHPCDLGGADHAQSAATTGSLSRTKQRRAGQVEGITRPDPASLVTTGVRLSSDTLNHRA